MNNDHLTEPMLTAAMDEVIRLRVRVEALEKALREILDTADPYGVECIAREALGMETR